MKKIGMILSSSKWKKIHSVKKVRTKNLLPVGKSFALICRKSKVTDLCLEIFYDKKTSCEFTLKRIDAKELEKNGFVRLLYKDAGPHEIRGRKYYKEGKNTFFGLDSPAATPSPIRSREALFFGFNGIVEGISC